MSSSFKSRTFYSVCPAFSIKKYEELEKILVKTITSKMKLPSILKKIQYISEMPKYVRRLFLYVGTVGINICQKEFHNLECCVDPRFVDTNL